MSRHTFTGSGTQLLDVQQTKGFGVRVELDCSKCTGPVVLSTSERDKPLADQPGPMKGEYAVAIETDVTDPQLTVSAKGTWRIKVMDWSLSPVRGGKVAGTGSRVFILKGTGRGFSYDFTPADPGDVLYAATRGPGKKDDSVIFGTKDVEKGSVVKAQLPTMVMINARGSWVITAASA